MNAVRTIDSRSLGLHYFLRSRRSVRRFLDQPVPGDILHRILETAGWSPSAHNRQPWRFAVLVSPERKTCLAEAMGADFRHDLLADQIAPEQVEVFVTRSRQRILEAPVVVILCLDPSDGDPYPDARRQKAEYLMGVQSVSLAGGTLLLAAHAEGLGAVWVCAPLFAPTAVQHALGLPECWQPQGMILMGYPAKIPAARPRRSLDEVAVFL
jgi:coenzyme F420-0:L-glutamate ligase/coenzyme F420-1:gamma-L-glutamate ligase